jgi:tetratricopeptide (TPR) repeat protein
MLDLSSQVPQKPRRTFLMMLAISAVLLVPILFLPFRNDVSGKERNPASVSFLATAESSFWPISIDYPLDGSIFPPGITPPTFLWRDAAAVSWHIDVTFSDGGPPIHVLAKGERLRVGEIDRECISSTNELPKLTPQQAASWTWTPDSTTWTAIQAHSKEMPAKVTITGYSNSRTPSSRSNISLTTSKDPVGGLIFYRDVPLMPSEGANGSVQPLPPSAIHLIHWRVRDIRQPVSRTVLKDMPTCANCHSFSGDGKTMGIDIDGPSNDKGLYAIASVKPHVSIQNKDIVQWNTDGQVGQTRVGFMSQVSPDGKYVVSTFAGPSLDVSKSYFITNFKDYRFLQVFYPTRGILEWYSRATGKRQPLPGADDPRYVQTDGVWSPDSKYIVFARAEAKDPHQEGQKPAIHANDPNETPIQYDLYRIPFNDGRGGVPEPIIGASQNGMSNNFPKVSPDGRWIVFVQCHNGQLMRPDSQLFIVPFGGGEARRLRANTPLMNSWHSFSPNGRWLVFSSKARSPYTQMYLTHLNADGSDSPAILIDNATAANRAVNIPEFVNIPSDGMLDIQVPAVDLYKLMGQAMDLEAEGKNSEALMLWRKALSLDPNDARVQNGLGLSLYIDGKVEESFDHLRQAIRINPQFVESRFNLGKFLLQQGHPEEALPELEYTLQLRPKFGSGEEALAAALQSLGNSTEALAHWRKAVALEPKSLTALSGTAWLLATTSDANTRNGTEAVTLAESANEIASGKNPEVLDTLAAAYAEEGDFANARTIANRALDLAVAQKDKALADAIRNRLLLYNDGKPFREDRPSQTGTRTVAEAR